MDSIDGFITFVVNLYYIYVRALLLLWVQPDDLLRPQTSNSNELVNQGSPAERWTIKEIRRLLNSVLTYSLLTEHPI